MTMKKSYEQADVRIILLEFSDIVTTSGDSGDMDGDSGGGWDVN